MDQNQPVCRELQTYLNLMHECIALSLVKNFSPRSLRPRCEEIKHINVKKRNKWKVIYTSEYFLLLFQIKECNPLGVLVSVLSLRNGLLIEFSDKSNSKFNSVIIPVFHSISRNLLLYPTEFLLLRAIASSLQALIA